MQANLMHAKLMHTYCQLQEAKGAHVCTETIAVGPDDVQQIVLPQKTFLGRVLKGHDHVRCSYLVQGGWHKNPGCVREVGVRWLHHELPGSLASCA